jgi:hypothetical protein
MYMLCIINEPIKLFCGKKETHLGTSKLLRRPQTKEILWPQYTKKDDTVMRIDGRAICY